MRRVRLRSRGLAQYRGLIAPQLLTEIEDLAESLRGANIVHINATPDGGGVAELLRGLLPLMTGLGINVEWHVLDPDDDFFEVTKKFHNLLQGAEGDLSKTEKSTYLKHSYRTATQMEKLSPDLWFIHDPQPVAAGAAQSRGIPRIWRSHIDTSQPNPAAAQFLRPHFAAYRTHVYSHADYIFRPRMRSETHVIEPAIDPLTRKNRLMPRARAEAVVSGLGIDTSRPIVSQVARLDPWKDPFGVIDAFRLAREEVPGLQLVLLGVIEAVDDPEAVRVATRVRDYAEVDPDIHIFTEPELVGPTEVGAVQRHVDVLMQKSLREGFGLSATEAMWKGTPLVVGNVGGLRVQVENGITGYCVDTVDECAEKLVELLQDQQAARAMGRIAREHVRQNYLLPRLLRDHLGLYLQALEASRLESRDLPEKVPTSTTAA